MDLKHVFFGIYSHFLMRCGLTHISEGKNASLVQSHTKIGTRLQGCRRYWFSISADTDISAKNWPIYRPIYRPDTDISADKSGRYRYLYIKFTFAKHPFTHPNIYSFIHSFILGVKRVGEKIRVELTRFFSETSKFESNPSHDSTSKKGRVCPIRVEFGLKIGRIRVESEQSSSHIKKEVCQRHTGSYCLTSFFKQF